MKHIVREISKEIYDRAMENRRFITEEDMSKVFSVAELCGYGVYYPVVSEKNGSYFVSFDMGDSCD